MGIVPEISQVLGFSPQNEKMDGHFHALKVTLTGKQTAELIALSFPRTRFKTSRSPADSIHYSLNGLV